MATGGGASRKGGRGGQARGAPSPNLSGGTGRRSGGRNGGGSSSSRHGGGESEGESAGEGSVSAGAASPAPAANGRPAEDESRDQTYFGYYAQLTNQQNMLQDSVRTGTYQWAITQNKTDFADKVVLDVGAGSGILSFFALQAGARKVYAVEASDITQFARLLVRGNHVEDKITVLHGKLEDVTLPEPVDVVISEPMGVLLVHERMIETFVRGRLNWLKPGGRMFPSTSTIYLAPFTDQGLYTETVTKVRFWQQTDFHGVDLSALASDAMAHHFGQPVVGCFDPRILMAPSCEHVIDFETVTVEGLQAFAIPFRLTSTYTGVVHGLAGWFDVHFNGSDTQVNLTTSPFGAKTHWYQIRFLFKVRHTRTDTHTERERETGTRTPAVVHGVTGAVGARSRRWASMWARRWKGQCRCG
jgi:type I protein arginine methyltransferase